MFSPSKSSIAYTAEDLHGLGPDSDPVEVPQYSEEDEAEIPAHSEMENSESGNDSYDSGFGAPDVDEPYGDDEEEDLDYQMEGQDDEDEEEDMFANMVRLIL